MTRAPRLVGLAILALALGAAFAAIVLPGARGAGVHPDRYRVDVIFDSARGMLPGQEVKVAGVRVGLVRAVGLTRDYKARLTLDVDGRFAPFRTDARCSLQPEGLIAERFVQCDPGTPSHPRLTGHGDVPPTVPVEHTTLPVDLTDLFNVFNVPTAQRLTVLLSALGAGVAGRGEDLNAILRRSNPTLLQVRRVLGTLDRQRAALRTAITATERVTGALAPHRAQLQAFISRAAGAGEQLARRSDALTAAVRRLPATLRATRPALRDLDTTARALTPVLDDVRAAAPPLERTLAATPGFTAAARPALMALGRAAGPGLRFAAGARPVTPLLRRFAARSLPAGRLLALSLTELRDAGFFEGLLTFLYNSGAVIALHDGLSHIGPSLLGPAICSVDFGVGCVAGTDKHHGKRRRHRAAAPRLVATPGPSPQAPAPEATGTPAPSPSTTGTPAGTPSPTATPAPNAVQDILDFLLG